jgi:hypothetical protein
MNIMEDMNDFFIKKTLVHLGALYWRALVAIFPAGK